ncbi:MAG: DUF1553 domain-containing protein, partial [Verrucomicrobiae bacterium]|nr:DUF1553 domain-containing protein [Verrucomicrobiae bacterium]
RTNTPLQALTLLNDPAYLEMALGFADRVLTSEPSADFGRRLDLAYRLALQRTPSDAERKQLEAVYNERLSALDEKAALELLAEPLTVVKAGFTGDRRELAAWFFLSNILLNLDETITKS